MAYANSNDSNVWLNPGEIAFTDSDAVSVAAITEAERIIRGRLARDVSAATLNLWHFDLPAGDPTVSPSTIRGIAGKLAAGIRWRGAYQADSPDASKSHGQQLYNEALAEIDRVLSGRDTIDGVIIGGTQSLADGMFYPNDSTIGAIDDVKFSMGRRF